MHDWYYWPEYTAREQDLIVHLLWGHSTDGHTLLIIHLHMVPYIVGGGNRSNMVYLQQRDKESKHRRQTPVWKMNERFESRKGAWKKRKRHLLCHFTAMRALHKTCKKCYKHSKVFSVFSFPFYSHHIKLKKFSHFPVQCNTGSNQQRAVISWWQLCV